MFNMKFLIWILLVITVSSTSIHAHEGHQFRSFKPIATANENKQALPEGARSVEQVQQLSREQVEPLVRDVIEKWNTGEMAGTLSDQFYDKSRLLDVMDTGVPRDAKLRVQSIQGIQTLQQYKMPADNGRQNRVSIVSATARTQLEFNTKTGFTRLQGTNEFILKITQPAPL